MALHKRVLIANRGEIAIRIARAASALGIESVGIYSRADARSLHTSATTEAHEIGDGGDAVGPYLDAEALVALAERTGCDCVHPGYGFLSENAEFAERCHRAGIAFIGPSPAALALFGDKVRSRELARSIDVPIIPGSADAVTSVEQTKTIADELGYPVMLKASAGGGGRGMRLADSADELEEAFDRCRGEAEAAFGDGALFVEKAIQRPRHVEVQVLADAKDTAVHLFERDCSVQLRHQKVIEIAPAPNLEPALRDRIRNAALAIAREGKLESAATVEFLVSPKTDEFWFIECNPRIQVEHTVTEQVTGLDLVELQFRIASGESLSQLGLGDPNGLDEPARFAVQARVVSRGAGTLSAYREPSGVGVRVDGSGYVGYAPPPQFDPLLAKCIGSSGSAATLESAIARTRAALAEFHVEGVPTNISSLCAILSHQDVIQGDARTSLLTEHPELVESTSATPVDGGRDPIALFAAGSRAVAGPGAVASSAPITSYDPLDADDADEVVDAPVSGSVVQVGVAAGDTVEAGDTLFVLSTMKMETTVVAPCGGTVSALAGVSEGDTVEAGRPLAAIAPAAGAARSERPEGGAWGDVLGQVATLQKLAHDRLEPGSQDPGVVRQRSRGKLTCRERIDLLLDEGTFREVGSIAGFPTYDDEGRAIEFTPANQVGGWGEIERRTAVVCADDFTSRGGHSDGAIAQKSFQLDRLSVELRAPSVRLLDGSSGGGSVASMVPKKKEGDSEKGSAKESHGAIKSGRPRVSGGGGSFLPPHLGSTFYGEQLATVPVVNVLLGSVVGLGAAKAVLGHFSVMVRDIAQLFVAGPPVVQHAMGYDITKEELGGWHIHCQNGSVDNLAESEQDAMEQTKRFLSYLPSSVYEAPPIASCADARDRREEELLDIIPRNRTSTFDIRKTIGLVFDQGSFFEVGPLWGTDQVTGFARLDGHPVGIIASDSRHTNGGALTADGCKKMIRHVDVCDLFHIPVVNLLDNPGFAVGLEHELRGTIRLGGEWMVALGQVQVPVFTVILRRSFGVAGNNLASPTSRASMRVAWPSADVGGIPPEGGIEAAYKRQLAEAADPVALRAEIEARIESARGPIGPLSRFQIEEMIDPRDTRRLACEWIRMAYRVVSEPGSLAPRGLGFRP